MKTIQEPRLKIKTLMLLAAASDLARFKWTVKEIKEHVIRVAGSCRTKAEALKAMNESVTVKP